MQPVSRVETLVAQALAPYSDDQQVVDRAARWIAQAELLGLPEFGVNLLLRDLAALDRSAQAELAQGEPGAGSPSPGIIDLAAAVDRAADEASSNGVSAVGLQGVRGMGILGFAVRDLAERGLAGILLAHAPAIVAPWGGSGAAIGTNPIAVAMPRSDAPPIVIDVATSELTMAALRTHRRDGTPIPEGALLDDTQVDGVTPPVILAGHRTVSLIGFVVELLAGTLTGSRMPASRSAEAVGRGALLLAIDPAHVSSATDVAQLASTLAHDWSAAGGHTPARFDSLPLRDEPLTGSLAIPAATLEQLQQRTVS